MSRRSTLGLLPWSVCFAVFGLIPLLAALALSFYSMNPLRPDLTHWIGVSNYARAFRSPEFWHALRTTAIFVVGTLPVTLTLAYIVAALLSRLRRGETFFRAAIFFPATLSMVVISLIFKSLYAEQGLLNGWLAAAGLTDANSGSCPRHLPRQGFGRPGRTLPRLRRRGPRRSREDDARRREKAP